ncbi:hypothetical protein O9929_15350 [Vibrio lentus]|nr:hypothetical protein [Vibrio lentus]
MPRSGSGGRFEIHATSCGKRVLRKNPKRVTLIATVRDLLDDFPIGYWPRGLLNYANHRRCCVEEWYLRPERPMAVASQALVLSYHGISNPAAVVYYLAQLSDIQHLLLCFLF